MYSYDDSIDLPLSRDVLLLINVRLLHQQVFCNIYFLLSCVKIRWRFNSVSVERDVKSPGCDVALIEVNVA